MDTINIKLQFGKTTLDFTFEPTGEDVVAIFEFIAARMANKGDDPTALKIAGFTDRLSNNSELLEDAANPNPNQPQGE